MATVGFDRSCTEYTSSPFGSTRCRYSIGGMVVAARVVAARKTRRSVKRRMTRMVSPECGNASCRSVTAAVASPIVILYNTRHASSFDRCRLHSHCGGQRIRGGSPAGAGDALVATATRSRADRAADHLLGQSHRGALAE